MKSTSTAAIILGGMNYREGDRIATLLTLAAGKVRGLARGARKSRQRFGGALELFSWVEVRFVPKEGLVTLLDTHAVNLHPAIRLELPRIAGAGYACELVDRFLPEGLPNPRLFRLLATYLGHLDRHPYNEADLRFFEINLLNILGYRPDLTASSLLGAATVDRLTQCLTSGRFGSVRFTAAELREASRFLDRALASHLDRPLKSLEFLREISGSQND